jgi:ubiquinone/menaquinone biosynthesis C-methylase UbiE
MSDSHHFNDRERFNQWSETYDKSYLQWLLFNRVHQGVLRRISPEFIPSRILDIGCGTGLLLNRMHERWPSADLIGIDPAVGMAAKSRLRIPTARIYLAIAEQLPFMDNSIDLVTSTTAFHHWSDQFQGVCEVARVLHTGGLFALADETFPWHGHPLSRARIRVAFSKAGLLINSQTNLLPFFTFTIGEKLKPVIDPQVHQDH